MDISSNNIIFIPIKEHSSRVPHKNFRDFCGRPLYLHTLYKYENLDVDVFVDTDSQEVLDTIGKKKKNGELSNVSVLIRKESLRGDDVSVNLLIQDFIDNSVDYKKDVWIAQIHVTTPFLKAKTVLSGLKRMKLSGVIMHGKNSESTAEYDSAASVTVHQSRFWRFDKYGFCPVNHNPMKLEKTQDLPIFYEENSCFYIFNPKNFNNCGKYRLGALPCFIGIDFPENLDIDTEDDWNKCVKLMSSGAEWNSTK